MAQIDRRSAFNTTNHSIHLEYLSGLWGTVVQWFQSYLKGKISEQDAGGLLLDFCP